MKTILKTAALSLTTTLFALAIPMIAKAEREVLKNPKMVIVVNKAKEQTAVNAQTLEVFVDGELLFRTAVSSGKEKMVKAGPSKNYPNGREYFAGTPVGAFVIHRRNIDHVSGTWDGVSMPFAQFFRNGIAFHAALPSRIAMLGKRDSGGCVRLHPRDAKILWKLVDKIGVKQTQVLVYDGAAVPHPLGRLNEIPRHAGVPTLEL